MTTDLSFARRLIDHGVGVFLARPMPADKMAWAWQMVELYGQAYPRPPLSSDGA